MSLYQNTFLKLLGEDMTSGGGDVLGPGSTGGGYADGDARVPFVLGSKKSKRQLKRQKRRKAKRKKREQAKRAKRAKKTKKKKIDTSSSEAFPGDGIHTRFGSTFSGPSFGSTGTIPGFGTF